MISASIMKFSFFVCLSFLGPIAFAEGERESREEKSGISFEFSDYSYLNKLSQSLRGIPPDPSEYAGLRDAIRDGKSSEYLREKIGQYTRDASFAEMLAWRLETLFRLGEPRSRLLSANTPPDMVFNIGYQYDPMVNLFRDISRDNRSWDELLTSKSYRLPVFDGGISPFKRFYEEKRNQDLDLGVSAELLSFGLKIPQSFEQIQFNENDLRIAGALTTPRFFQRYGTTGLNKNRRRAAAVFRIFLCDNMIPAIPEKHDTGKLADLMFAESGNAEGFSSSDEQMPTENQIREAAERKHGEQADCMSCHYKLDPLGKNFRASATKINGMASPGSLIYKTRTGSIVNMPTNGIGDLANAIVQQKEYRDCQVRHFWNWYIGEDVQLTVSRTGELGDKFDALGRRPQDFVSYLVQLPEFRMRSRPSELQSLVLGVRKIFNKCASCHVGKRSEMLGSIPDLNSWPIGVDHEFYPDPKFWLGRISINLGLETGGRGRRMPPLDEGFRISVDELVMVKRWIEMGGPDEMGKTMVPPVVSVINTRK